MTDRRPRSACRPTWHRQENVPLSLFSTNNLRPTLSRPQRLSGSTDARTGGSPKLLGSTHMSRVMRRGLTGLVIAVALATTAAGTAFAHPEGETDGGTHVGNEPRD